MQDDVPNTGVTNLNPSTMPNSPRGYEKLATDNTIEEEESDFEENNVEERVHKLYDKLGGCGLFQVVAYIAIAFGMSGPSWFIYEIGYLT